MATKLTLKVKKKRHVAGIAGGAVLLLAFFGVFSGPSSAGSSISVDQIRPELIPADAEQLVVVHSATAIDTATTVQTFQRKAGSWASVAGPLAGHVGRSGLSGNRTEGDGSTPSGTYSLTEAFGIQPYDAAKLPYRTIGPYDWWVSDSQAPDYYNSFQTTTPAEGDNPIHWRGAAGEHLITKGRAYNYAVVVNYNRPPTVPKPVPPLGSAIFLHVDTGKPTSGCVSIDEDAMKSVLSWLDPTKHPAIVIGTDDDLLTPNGAPPVIGTTAQGIDYVTPVRVLDTRDGTGRPGRAVGPVGPQHFIDLQVVPTVNTPVADGVPSNATAVALNLTLTGPTADTFLTVFPTPGDGSNPPLVSNVNARPGEDRANLVLVGVQPGTGLVRIYNKHGSADVVADVVGYVSPTSTGRVQPVNPYRIVDTRDGTGVSTKGPLDAPSPILVPVPFAPAHATAVIANITVVDPTDGTWVAAFGGGDDWGGTSTVNTKASETSANLAVAPLGAGNTIKLLNHWGKAHVVVDVAGFVLADGSRYVPAKVPQRVLDTREGLSIRGRIGPDEAINVQIPGLPSSATAVALTLTGVNPSAGTHLTVQAAGTATVQVSNVNLDKGTTRANLVIVPVSNGVITIRNKNGSIDLVADVSGWFEP